MKLVRWQWPIEYDPIRRSKVGVAWRRVERRRRRARRGMERDLRERRARRGRITNELDAAGNVTAIVVDVPGCSCDDRTQAQLDCGDVCDACVSYFDLGPMPDVKVGTSSHHRGHRIYFVGGVHLWRYRDTDAPVADGERDCGKCDRPRTPEGHDACLGTLPGVMNACCGHGLLKETYVQLEGGSRLAGQAAVEYIREHVDTHQEER